MEPPATEPPPKRRAFDAANVTEPEATHLRTGFGSALREARVTAGLSQSELANTAEVSRTTIQGCESGTMRPTADLIALLSLILRRPQPALPGIRMPRRSSYELPLDLTPANELEAHLSDLAGDSLREPTKRAARHAQIAHWRRYGMSKRERAAKQSAETLAAYERQRAEITRLLEARGIRPPT